MNQKGFTLIELLAVMAVGGMIMAAALLTIYQIVWGTERTNDQVVALTDVNFAALWLKKDFQMAQETNLEDGDPVPKSSLELRWIDNTGWSSNTTHSANYTLSGTQLIRNYDGTMKVVGRYISSIGFTQNGRVITANITATGPGIPARREALEFDVRTRIRTDEL